MAELTSGIITSFSNTPQAKDDYYENSLLTEDASSTFIIDVMGNDLGGKAKTLYSLDNGVEDEGSAALADLLTKDIVGQDNVSRHGALIEFTADSKVAYTMTAASKAYFQSLGADEVGFDTFTYAIRLSNGAIAKATVTVEIQGANDGAVIGGTDSGAVKEDVTTQASGDLTISDVDGADEELFVAQSATNDWGTFNFDDQGQWTFDLDSDQAQSLGEGDAGPTQYFTVYSVDGTAHVIDVSITGSNDEASVGDDSAAVTEGDDAAALAASGSVTISDADAGEEELRPEVQNGVYGDLTVNADGTWSYAGNGAHDELTDGQQVSDVFVVTSEDGTGTGTVTINITGSNDAAILSNADVALDETNAPLMTGGTLTNSDVDNADTFQAQADVAGSYGDFSIDANGVWSYEADSAFDELNVGDSVSDTFDVYSADGTATSVTVTINGKNDNPTNSGAVVLAAIAEDSGVRVITQAELLFNSDDVDSDSLTATGLTIATGSGTLVNNGNGTWNYTPALNDDTAVSFSYSIEDGDGGSVAGSASMDITPVADIATAPPVYTGTGDPNDNDTLTGSASGTTGTNSADTLVGGTGTDTLSGGGGNDALFGRGGDDFIYGGDNNDKIYGGAGNDYIEGNVNNDDIWGGSGNDTILGNNNADVIFGGSGNDSINGGDNTDKIAGGYGADALTGGSGNDDFIFLSLLDTGDTITDFATGDKLDFSAIDANTATLGNGTFAFVGNTTSLAANSVIFFVHDNGTAGNTADDYTVVQADTDGNTATAEFQIQLTGTISLVVGDFVL